MGIRIWVGQEQEGKCVGKKTLFVETQELTIQYIKEILRCAKMHNTKRVYLGAGKIELLKYDVSQIQTLLDAGCEIIIECLFSNRAIYDNIISFISQLILRIECDNYNVQDKYVFKIDDNRNACIYQDPWVNNLQGVYKGLYTQTDKLIWEE